MGEQSKTDRARRRPGALDLPSAQELSHRKVGKVLPGERRANPRHQAREARGLGRPQQREKNIRWRNQIGKQQVPRGESLPVRLFQSLGRLSQGNHRDVRRSFLPVDRERIFLRRLRTRHEPRKPGPSAQLDRLVLADSQTYSADWASRATVVRRDRRPRWQRWTRVLWNQDSSLEKRTTNGIRLVGAARTIVAVRGREGLPVLARIAETQGLSGAHQVDPAVASFNDDVRSQPKATEGAVHQSLPAPK